MNKTKLLAGLMVLVIGLFMCFAPTTCQKIVVILIGCSMCINGVYNIGTLSNLVDDIVYKRVIIAKGAFSILIGLVSVLLPIFFIKAISGAVTLMVYLLAISLFLCAMAQIYALTKMYVVENKKHYLLEVVITILVATILCLLGPNVVTKVTRFLGIVLVAVGIVLLVWQYIHRYEISEYDGEDE